MTGQMSRRTVLKGLGTAIALPLFEGMLPGVATAAAVATRKAAPKRMAFLYVPNGVHMQDWTPKAEGTGFALPATLEPLKPFQQDFMVLSGLTADKARPNGDGPGDHARALSAFLTGRQARKTHGADIRAGISVDQIAAEKVAQETRFRSLELGCEPGRQAGNCDSGYSCAYSCNISWRTESTPNASEINPRLVFERLFSNGVKGEAATARAKRERYRLSVLDLVMEDANNLRHRLGATDQKKMDEYLTAVRELEMRLVRDERVETGVSRKGRSETGVSERGKEMGVGERGRALKPAGVPTDYGEHVRLMADMMALAFQGDLTRVATFVIANEGSNRSYGFLKVPEGHHDLSHHGGDKAKHAKLQKINHFHASQLAYLLGKLKGIKEGDGTLLDNCMIVYGSGIGDGNAHNHDELPILLAGKGNGTLKPGRHVRYKRNTPLTNLYVAMLDLFGAPVKSFGDSNGKLEGLA